MEPAFSAGAQAAALEGMDCAAAVLNIDGEICYVNRAWCDFALANGGPADGYAGQEYLGSVDTTIDGRLSNLRRSLADVLAGVLDGFSFEYPCDAPGERRWFMMRVNAIEHDGARWAVVLHVQVAKSTLDPDQLLNGESREDQRLRSRLLRLVGHQFRTPLTPIQMDARVLAMQEDSPDADIARRIARNAERLSRVVTNSIALLNLEEGSTLRPQGRLALRSLRQCAEYAGQELNLKDRLRISVEGKDAPTMLDLAWIGRAVRELVDNAAQFTTGGIHVRIAMVDGVPELAVEDRGEGGERLQALFEPFNVGDEHENTVGRAGLGLAIVKAVAEGHGGTVTVDHGPEVGGGTAVVLRFPGAQTQSGTSEVQESSQTTRKSTRPATRPASLSSSPQAATTRPRGATPRARR